MIRQPLRHRSLLLHRAVELLYASTRNRRRAVHESGVVVEGDGGVLDDGAPIGARGQHEHIVARPITFDGWPSPNASTESKDEDVETSCGAENLAHERGDRGIFGPVDGHEVFAKRAVDGRGSDDGDGHVGRPAREARELGEAMGHRLRIWQRACRVVRRQREEVRGVEEGENTHRTVVGECHQPVR